MNTTTDFMIAWRKITSQIPTLGRYSLVGIGGTLIDLAALYLLVEFLKLPVLLAAALSFVLAVTHNFIFNKIWTFDNRSSNYRKLYLKFLSVSLAGLGLTLGLMYVFFSLLGWWYMLAKVLTSLLVLSWNFLANKFWTFGTPAPAGSPRPDLSTPYSLSVILPAYNEAGRISSTLEAIDSYFLRQQIPAEVIVVNDGSRDETARVVEDFPFQGAAKKLINLPRNRGKGEAVKQGVQAARGELILFMDADNSTSIEELESLKQALRKEGAGLAIGSRYLPRSHIQADQPFYRRRLSRIGNRMIRVLLISQITDTQCGFKLFTARAAREIFSRQRIQRFAFDVEILAIARALQIPIVEVPVEWFNSPHSKVRPVKDSLLSLKDMAYIKFNLLTGRYRPD